MRGELNPQGHMFSYFSPGQLSLSEERAGHHYGPGARGIATVGQGVTGLRRDSADLGREGWGTVRG